MRQGKRRISRWLFPDARPPRSVRLGFFAAGLVVLAGSYALTGSDVLQLPILLALTFLMLPMLARRFGVRDPYWETVRDRNLPARVVGLSLVFGLPWVALVF